MTEDEEQALSVFCHLTSAICYLTPDTRHLYLRKRRLIESLRVL